MKKIFTLMSTALMVLALGYSQKAMAEDTYVVAGVATLMGSNWDGNDTNNQMTLQDDGTYKLVKENIVLNGGSYGYKVVKNGSQWIPDGMGNDKMVQITEDGTYDVTFTFTPDDASTIKAVAVKKGEGHIEINSVLVAGSSEKLFGTSWDETNQDNLLEKQSDGSFMKVYENVELSAGNIEYKFIVNGVWEQLESGGNRVINISNSGVYNVTFLYAPADHLYGAWVEEVSINPLVIEVMSITGELTGGWANADWSNEGAWMDMTQDTNNPAIWTLTVEGFEAEAKTYYYKAAANHNWNEFCIPGDGSNNDYYFSEAGIYTLKFVVDTEKGELTLDVEKTGDIVIDIPALYILGEANDNGWSANVGLAMTKTGDATFEAEEVTFKGANEGYSYFGFTKQLMNEADDWDNLAQYRIGAVADGAFLVTDEYLGTELALTAGQVSFQIPAGIYTLKADLAAMKLVITKTGEYSDNPNAIEQVENSAIATVWYNLQGQRVAAPVKGVNIHNGRKVVVK